MKGVAWLVSAGAAALLAAMALALRGPNPPPLWLICMFFAVLIVSVLAGIEMTWNCVEWTEHEIVQRSPWNGERPIPWTDVESVEYSIPNRWVIVTSRLSTKVRVHELMGGMTELSETFRAQLSAEILRQATKGMDRHFRVGR